MLQSKRGQLVVEYVLLILVVTVIATAALNFFVKRGDTPSSEDGAIIRLWQEITGTVGCDFAGDPEDQKQDCQ